MTDTQSAFNATDALAQLRKEAAVRRRSVYHPSRLDRHAFELHSLIKVGAKPAELQRWLRTERRCKVALSTVTRWIARNVR